MSRTRLVVWCLLIVFSCTAFSQSSTWNFAVSGDSRNCGDVVMPAIATRANQNHAAFYWHLGDLRAIFAPDEDYLHEPEHRGQPRDMTTYLDAAWDDFIQNQLSFFGQTPVYVGIGNHEVIAPKTREDFIAKFNQWLNSPVLQKQRQSDHQDETVGSYYHWIQGGVDFIYLDNATPDEFDSTQLAWFEDVLKKAGSDKSVRTVVMGMHEALPNSLAFGHSMNDFPAGTVSGRQVYSDLLRFKEQRKKQVYVLASHSHFYMSGIFDTEYWRSHGGVLPGWIVGTGGAMRYQLPPESNRAKEAREKVYGYLLGTVHRDGKIDFNFQEIKRADVPEGVAQRYTPEFADYCFNENTDFRPRPAAAGAK
jgi:Calcineurin-like phosphoesterase